MRVALIHDWLVAMRGGEKCLEVFSEIFPEADLYTLVYAAEKVSPTFRRMKIHTSWLNGLPMATNYFRYFLPFFPAAIEAFELRDYDLILSSNHCVAKGIFPHRALHLSYIHAPMRYVWDMYDSYFTDGISPTRGALWACRPYLRRWDVESAGRVDYFIANSRNVAAKVNALYGKPVTVIYPPVDIEKFQIRSNQEPYYLVVSALVPYKRIDLAVAAFNKLKLPLKIAGDGPLRKRLERAAGRNIEFLGWVDDPTLAELYGACQALIFPGEEDFGIVPLEAQATGRPVIGYGRGGLQETVIPLDACAGASAREAGPTGIFFTEQTPGGLIAAVELFERIRNSFDPVKIQRHAAGFSRDRFKAEVKGFIEDRLKERRG
jgi:glycosyltransferase involved in cell wall biosynthesis